MKLNQLIRVGILAVAASLSSQAARAETLRVGMECTYAPFNYRDSSGELTGYDVDVAKGVAEIIGADLEFVCQKWDGMIPALLANKFDLIVASMSITEERKRQIDFSEKYYQTPARLVAAKGAGFEGTAAGLAGKRIGDLFSCFARHQIKLQCGLIIGL